MDFLVENISTIFCYFTGILIAWSSYLSYEHYKIICFKKDINESPCKYDMIQMIFLIMVSLFLILSLFVFPTSITPILDTLIVLEIWYAVYLFRVSVNVYKSLKFIHNLTPQINISHI